MKDYITANEWSIIEKDLFYRKYNRITESLMSIGNGKMGQRANFEEAYSGDTFQGSYVAGIYYPDKTRVGWWKNGYPEYFAKVLNSANWIGIDVYLGNRQLDLNQMEILSFQRELNMREGYLDRKFRARFPDGLTVNVHARRFCSMADDECGAIMYSITPEDFEGTITCFPYIDFDVVNEDSNYDEQFWEEVNKETEGNRGFITARTKKLDFHVCAGMHVAAAVNGKMLEEELQYSNERNKYIELMMEFDVHPGDTVSLYKYASVVASINYDKDELPEACLQNLDIAEEKGFDQMLKEQAAAWADKWAHGDIRIEGDVKAQQGIRFNIFQLNQTYTGKDGRLNIGPKGFTGEKYGGSTYWDTEAYCLPFYLSTSEPEVSKNLLIYRYNHLQKAIDNAEKLGFHGGAALYPMVTMNGEECHNEWEITFEEIHRNGAIAYAIHDYIRYTKDKVYLATYGLPVLIGIARFWAQRITFSKDKRKYVMLGVTGPNEYENNVNNNWYTNYIACWCMRYASESIAWVKDRHPDKYAEIVDSTKFNEEEIENWQYMADNMYYPIDIETGIFLQQDGFLDKELIPVSELDPVHLPLNQKWSWDRILRSCYIKQADVLQGLYFFEEHFGIDNIRRNFDFYEPMTVHESSLSPCVHVILAARLGYEEKAYDLYLRTARLDLDDYNNDTEDGCHITSMAGTWMSVTKGFGGMRIDTKGDLVFSPMIPRQWKSYSFKILFREAMLKVTTTSEAVKIEHLEGPGIKLHLYGETYQLEPESNISVLRG
jgi:maltose phosphorylase